MPELRTKDPVIADEEKMVKQLRAMARARRASPDIDLVGLARETKSPRIRNETALTLAALGTTSGARVIAELLSRDDTRGARGTLLYALNEMKEGAPLEVLVEIIVTDGYESQEEALLLLRKSTFDETARLAAVAKLKPFKQSKDKHMSLLAAEAIDILTAR
jgi:HEAT repeat protein